MNTPSGRLPLLVQRAAVLFGALSILLPVGLWIYARPRGVGTTEYLLLGMIGLYCVGMAFALGILFRLLAPGESLGGSMPESRPAPLKAPVPIAAAKPKTPVRATKPVKPTPPPAPAAPVRKPSDYSPAIWNEEIFPEDAGANLDDVLTSNIPSLDVPEPAATPAPVVSAPPPVAEAPPPKTTIPPKPAAENDSLPLLPEDARALSSLYESVKYYVDMEYWPMALVKAKDLVGRFPLTPEAEILKNNLGFLESRAARMTQPRAQSDAA